MAQKKSVPQSVRDYMALIGARGGRVSSPTKLFAARENAKRLNKSHVPKTLDSTFWSKFSKGDVDSCWEWHRPRFNGYGMAFHEGKEISAHRLSWILHNGPIPEGEGYHGTCVCHRCDNPRCVNPAHLFLGTMKDNAEDMVAKKRQGKRGRPRKETK